MESPPQIPRLAGELARPFVSVMIPTYNSNAHLRQTLESVLAQGQSSEKMEIVVVDNCSDREDPESLVREIGKGRVAFHRNERNLGLSGNFNRCIELARGDWVHILHSDDFVYDGFYTELEKIATEHPVDAVAFRCDELVPDGKVRKNTYDLSGLDPEQLRRSFLRPTPVLCPGVVVKRAAYERLGGWMPFRYVLDTEVWTRIFFNAPTFYSPKKMAVFRWHKSSEGAKLRRAGMECREIYELQDYMQRNMRLTREESRYFKKHSHRMVNDCCRDFAKAGELHLWLQGQKLYLAHLRHPVDVIDFVLRFGRNLICYLRSGKGKGVSTFDATHR